MRAGIAVVGLEQRVHAEAFADGAEQCQKSHSECAAQQKPVAPHRCADAGGRQPHPKAQVLGVAELRLDGPAAGGGGVHHPPSPPPGARGPTPRGPSPPCAHATPPTPPPPPRPDTRAAQPSGAAPPPPP